MTDLVVRRLLIDLNTPFPGRWNGGDAFRSAFFSALSMSFPVGEQYFIDSVRAGLKALPESEGGRFAREVQGFVGQEATHRRLHGLFNGHLERLGYRNQIERRAQQRLKDNAHRAQLLAGVAAFGRQGAEPQRKQQENRNERATGHGTSRESHWSKLPRR